MAASAPAAAAARALVFCRDIETRRLVLESLRPFAILPELCEDSLTAVSLLDKQKFEAVITDLALGDEARLIVRRLELSPSNRRAVTFGIGCPQTPEDNPDAMFLFRWPLTPAPMVQTVKAAYGLIVRERRRSFRCPVSVPAFLWAGGSQVLMCNTVNISEGGLAVAANPAWGGIKPQTVRFSLPGSPRELSSEVRATWQHEDGLMGLQFTSLNGEQAAELQEWLRMRLDEALPPEVAELFRGAVQSAGSAQPSGENRECPIGTTLRG